MAMKVLRVQRTAQKSTHADQFHWVASSMSAGLAFGNALGVNSVGRPQEADRGVARKRPEVWSEARSEFRPEFGAQGSDFDEHWSKRRRCSRGSRC